MDEAITLRQAGNVLFASRKYMQAYEKYSAAIELDQSNAILFTNRAACGLEMKRCNLFAMTNRRFIIFSRVLDAMSDAQKAVKLDPKYAKGWSRLAQCQQETGNWTVAVRSWKKALECVPTMNLTPAEQTLRRQFKEGLRSAENRIAAAKFDARGRQEPISREDIKSGGLPWERAKAMMSHRPSESGMSSAWVIFEANKQFSEGMGQMSALKKDQFGKAYHTPGTVEKILDGILRDKRVIDMMTLGWTDRFNVQVLVENHALCAWINNGPEEVIDLAQKRILEKGWQSAGPAIALTIRYWVMNGFLTYAIARDSAASVKWFTGALEVLERGQRVWKDISDEVRGMVFTDNFIRAVRSLHLEVYLDACESELGKFNKTYTSERVLELADDIYLDSCKTLSQETNNPSTILSFRHYPAGMALATKGWYHKQKAAEADCTPELCAVHNMKCAKLYLQAAKEWIPQDDELHCWYLRAALYAMLRARAPLSSTLPVMAEIRKAYPEMKRIWEFSTALKGRDETLTEILDFEKKVLMALQKGGLNMESRVLLGDKF
ncbi:hypothetical protein BD410DRAFT_843826 [Rickenella mellea]|uniref:Uncharacterized protein n=1 Tax=Rickenella mellea TaxID=50990 RepID=A0A4Y7PQB5_9AGAM|nr:hypothetical protein BD410DRAFT_843826 [Rickenella mellea]